LFTSRTTTSRRYTPTETAYRQRSSDFGSTRLNKSTTQS
jgi:hypothetical protein